MVVPPDEVHRRSPRLRVFADQPGAVAAATQGEAEVPELFALPAGAHNLPRTLSSFVGRRADLEQVGGLIATSPLVTITGPAGMGKTRLAIEVAGRVTPPLAGGMWLVELARIEATEDPERVAEAVASVFDVAPQPGQTFIDAVRRRLRNARLLVLLDNCEHVAAAAAPFAHALLSGGPGVSVLATSQWPLGVPGEQVWPLGPLSLTGLGRAGAGSDAVALFHARARAINPGFVVTDEGAAAVADTCRRLDGIPLAIELAAARTAVLSPTEIAELLDERFGLLTAGSPVAVPRHRSLQAALDWSWDLLAPPEQALLRRLSVFTAGAGLGEVRAVCTGGEVGRGALLDLLSSLVSKSLVVADTTGVRAHYRLLETVQAYGRHRLEEAGEARAVKELHAHWYLGVAENGWHRLVGAGDHRSSDTLEAQHDNLRAGLAWFLADGDGRTALRMGSALTPFWRARGHFREGRQILERALALGTGAPAAMRVRGLWGVGILSLMQCDFDRATTALEESLALARHHGLERPAMEARNLLAFIWVFTKDPATALPVLEQSVAWARARQDDGSLVAALALCGRAHLFGGDTDGARAVFEECRQLDRASGGRVGKGLVGLGWVALTEGRHDEASRLLDEALPLVRRCGDTFETALVVSLAGELAGRRGDHRRARDLLQEGAELALAMGAPFPLSRCLLGLGRVAHASGDHTAACELIDEAVEAARRARFPSLVVRCLAARADLHREAGDLDGARARLEEASELAAENGDPAGRALVLMLLGCLARLEGDYQRSASLHAEALEKQVELGHLGGVADSLDHLARLAIAQDRAEHAARLLGAADGVRRAAGSARAPTDGLDHDRVTAKVRAALGGLFEQAFGQGAALSFDEAIALATRGRGGPRRPSTGWASLTPTERRVVDLVAEGLTNPEIADRMFLSPRTIQSHLTRAFPKLGVTSRRELREVVRRRQEA